MSGDTYHLIPPKYPPGNIHRDVFLAEVNPVGPCPEGECRIIVHNEHHSCLFCNLPKPLRHTKCPLFRQNLLPVLNNIYPSLCRFDGNGDDIPVCILLIQDQIESADLPSVWHNGYGFSSWSTKFVEYFPARNSGLLRSLLWNGIVVFIPSITNSSSARLILDIASSRSEP